MLKFRLVKTDSFSCQFILSVNRDQLANIKMPDGH